MPYTRRDLLRDATVATAAGVAGPSLALLEGCKSKQVEPVAVQSPRVQVTPAAFALGVRLFFEGAWLFCSDPTNNKLMRAVTMDMTAVPHYFRYGLWVDPWVNSASPQLPVYDPKNSPAAVTLATNPNPAPDIDTLFAAAQTDSPFTYLYSAKPSTPNTIKWNSNLLRVISIPMPTRIIPAAFRKEASLDDLNHHRHPLPSTCVDIGIATTHIFEYTGGDSMVFSLDPSTTVKAATDATADYHFHAAPQSTTPDITHAPAMFDAMLQLITNFPHKEIKLVTPLDPGTLIMGPNVPSSVALAEVGMHSGSNTAYLGDIPTCTMGGIGVGGNCC